MLIKPNSIALWPARLIAAAVAVVALLAPAALFAQGRRRLDHQVSAHGFSQAARRIW
jgi:hypothetical protein